jgi:hypothetical protein
MTVDPPIWTMLAHIRNAELKSVDRELLRPAFTALDDGKTLAVPTYVESRIRDIYARTPK